MTTEKKDLLIVEDNLDLCDIYKIAFEAAGFNVRLSTNGMDGIVKSLEKKPDVILLDLMMPDMDGFEVLKALRQNSSLDVVIIINSNLSQQKDISHALELGANRYLQKSNYSPAELIQEVKKIISGQSPASQSAPVAETKNLKEQELQLIFSQEILGCFAVRQVNLADGENTVLLEEKDIAPVWNGKGSTICGFLTPATIKGTVFGKKPLTLIAQRHSWQVEGEKTKVMNEIAFRENQIVMTVKESSF